MSRYIESVDGIVQTVGIQVVAEEIAIHTQIANVIGTDEPPKLRAIVPRIEIVHPRLGVEIIPPIPERILDAHAGAALVVPVNAVTPSVVGICRHDTPGAGPCQCDNVPLKVVDVVVQHTPAHYTHT